MSTLVDYTYPLEHLLERMKFAGFDAVAFGHKTTHFPFFDQRRVAEVGEICGRLGLFVDYIHTPIDLSLDLSSENEHVRNSTIEICKAAVDAVKELQGRAITVHLTNKEEMSDDEIGARVPLAAEAIKVLGDYSAKRGVLLCLENLPFNFAYHRILERVLESYKGNSVYLCLDSCHISMGNPDPFEYIERNVHRIRTTHLSDNFGDRDLHLVPYTGTFDFDRLAKLLGENGYDGNVMLENSREAALKRFQTLQHVHREPKVLEIDDYLMKSFLAAKRFQLGILEARHMKAQGA
jgi:L-ribulose-5-phosphate 3-epimerase